MVYEDGTLFAGIEIGDCVNDWNSSGSHSTTTSVSMVVRAHPYGWRLDDEPRELSHGYQRAASISSGGVSTVVLFGTYRSVWKSVPETEGKWGDQLLASLR
jgi:hypothetical protein